MNPFKILPIFAIFGLLAGSAHARVNPREAVSAHKAHTFIANGRNVRGQGQIIAVIDTGINPLHPDIQGKIAEKTVEKIDGADNDGNNLKDDRNGWDYFKNIGLMSDENGHGTHVATTIVSEDYGIAPGASVIPIRVTFNPEGNYANEYLAKAIKYAADNGASIINLSLRGYYPDKIADNLIGNIGKLAIEEAINYAAKKDILLVVAAGNDHLTDITNLDILPAGSTSDNVLVVCATDELDKLAWFSNFSATKVDVCAPGVQIEAGNGKYGPFFGINGDLLPSIEPMRVPMNGTSMATPIVSGIAALIRSMDKSLTASMVKKIIMDSAARKAAIYPHLRGISVTGSIVNADDAVWEYMMYHRPFWQ